MVEPRSHEEVFVEGDRVVLCERASASLFGRARPDGQAALFPSFATRRDLSWKHSSPPRA